VDVTGIEPAAFPISSGSSSLLSSLCELEIGGRDRDRTCDLIHAMDALSQLSYTPVAKQNDLRMVWRTSFILTNLPVKFHCDDCRTVGPFETFSQMGLLESV
jgi:hypothetical protein